MQNVITCSLYKNSKYTFRNLVFPFSSLTIISNFSKNIVLVVVKIIWRKHKQIIGHIFAYQHHPASSFHKGP